MDRSNEYNKVKQLRSIVSHVNLKVSEATRQDYLKKFARMQATRLLPETLGKTPGSFYGYRAALLYCSAVAAQDALRKRDKATFQSEEWRQSMEEIDSLLLRFQRYRPGALSEGDPGGRTGPQWSDVRAMLEMEGQPIKRHSKKYLLRRLARHDDWRKLLFEAMPEQYKPAAAVMHITGCRPSELKNGVELKVVGGKLALTIYGTKVTGSSGQPKRVLIVTQDNPRATYLIALAQAGTQTISIASPKALTEAVAAAGQKAFPWLKARACPYLWRHALSSDMKSAGCEPEQIAMTLGHRVTRTQTSYGRHAHGSGSVSIIAVHASVGVRDTLHDPCSQSPTPSKAGPSFGL